VSALNLAGSLAKQLLHNVQLDREFPQLADAAASNALHRLLLVKLAVQTFALHNSVAEQCSGQLVLPHQHHWHLLQELGIAWLEHSNSCKGSASPLVHFAAASLALAHPLNLVAAARQVGEGSTSSSSSRAGVPSSSSPFSAASRAGSSSSCCSAVEEAALLTLLQAVLLLAAGRYTDWFFQISTFVESLLIHLDGPAREAAAAVMMQPFLTQLLPASITFAKAAKEAATEAATEAGNTAPLPLSTAHAGTTAAAVSASAAQQPPAEQESCLGYVTGALHVLLGTGGHCRIVLSMLLALRV
jgi:hypothetical protein